jgi:hypothetical protein
LKVNSRQSGHIANIVFSIIFIVMIAVFVLLFDQQKRSQVVSASDDDIPATLTFTPTVTPTAYMATATPVPTSTVPANVIVIDNANSSYPMSSLALNAVGTPEIAYAKGLPLVLSLALCNNALTCDAPLISTIDSDSSNLVKMVLDGVFPVFTFVDTDGDLKVGRCQNTTCTTSTLKTMESVGYIGEYALVLDQNHLPIIIYTQTISYVCDPSICTDNFLKLARCNNTACDAPTITEIASNPFIRGLSLVIDSNNNPIIPYSLNFQSSRMAICYDTTCTTKFTATLDPHGSGAYSSIQLDSNGLPIIAYVSLNELRLAKCNNNTTCNSPNISIIDNAQFTQGNYVSLALDSGNLPVMSYYDQTRSDLKIARCSDPACMGVEIGVLDSTGSVGSGSSLALSNGKAFISYINQTTGKLMLYIEDKPSLITPTLTFTPSLTPTSTSTPITPTSPPNATPAPFFFATHHPTLTWNRVSWAWGYRIEIDDDPAFGSPISADVDAHTLTYMVGAELPNGAYYWRVQAKKNASDEDGWSAAQPFIVSAP